MSTDVERLIARDHADPHAFLGAHPDGNGGVVVRAFRPGAERVVVHVGRRGGRARADAPGRALRGRGRAARRCRSTYGLEVDYPDGELVPGPRPVPLRADARRARPAPRRARAATRSCTRRSARTCARSTASTGTVVRGLGAGRALGQRRRRLQRLGRAAAPDALAGLVGDLGAVRARRRRRARATSSRSARRTARCSCAPTRSRSRPRCRPRPRRSSTSSEHEWNDDEWMEARRSSVGARRPDVDLRGPPRLVAARPGRPRPAALLRRARRRARRLRATTSASRTSS